MENIQILSDFDKTITPFSYLGTYCSATMGIFSGCDSISKEFQDDQMYLLRKYHPMETDPSLTPEQKILKIEEWYEKQRENFVKEHITKD